MIKNITDVARAYDAGRYWAGFMRRGGPAFTLGSWMDMSYAPGIPVANYYAATPLVSTQLSATDGILHGPDVNAQGFKKYLHKALIIPPATSVGLVTMIIHDIVAFYPFVDGDGGSQDMVNTLGTLRYAGGDGCRIMLVSQGGGVANATDAIVRYVNTAGESKTLPGVYLQNMAAAGQLVSNHIDATALGALGYVVGSPYLPVCPGCRGVSRITNIELPTAVGGIFAAVIVKPLGTISYQETTTPIEVDFIRERLSFAEVADGAYIHTIARGTVSATPATMHGQFEFIWG